MENTLGIIGCGSVVQSMYVYSIPAWKNIDKIYVYDIDSQQSAKVADTLNATLTGLENLIEKSGIILIASPPHTHYELLKLCRLPGKTVICEKPFLLNYLEAKVLCELAEVHGTQLFVAHLRRVLPAVELARQIIESGIMGEIKELQLFEGSRFAYHTKSGYETYNPFGGVLADTGSHTMDCALFVTGLDLANILVENVLVQKDKAEPSHEVKAEFIIKTGDAEIPVKLSLSRKQALANKINIIAENGILEMPLGLENSVRISKTNHKAFLANSAYVIDNYHQALALEYETIFNPKKNHIFLAKRFVNLALILEKLISA